MTPNQQILSDNGKSYSYGKTTAYGSTKTKFIPGNKIQKDFIIKIISKRAPLQRPDPSLDRSWGSKLEKVKQARYRAQEERKKELEETEKRIQTKIIYEEGSHLLTTMEDKIREWMFSKKQV